MVSIAPNVLECTEIADDDVLSFYCDMLGVDVRIVHDRGVPYFICEDMMQSLGYKSVNSMLHHADPEDRGHFSIKVCVSFIPYINEGNKR